MRSKAMVNVVLLAGAVAVVIVVVAVIAGGVSFPFGADEDPQQEANHPVRGVIALVGDAFGAPDGTCGATAGYRDIVEGAPVVIHDATGRVIATGTLGAGEPGQFFNDGQELIPGVCEFTFRIPDAPVGDFYGVQVGNRNVVMFSRAQVEAGPVKLTLGS